MNNENGRHAVMIDVTPDSAETSPRVNASRTAKWLFMIAMLVLVMASGLLFVAYQYAQEIARDLITIKARIERNAQAQEQVREQLKNARQAVGEQADLLTEQVRQADEQREIIRLAQQDFGVQEQKLQSERQRLRQREAELTASLIDVRRRIGTSGNQWRIAEAEYLVRIANHRLNLARDVETARIALRLADERLRDAQAPSWMPVREQIARDFGKLNKVNLPDIERIATRLRHLIEQVPQLPLKFVVTEARPLSPELKRAPRHERNWDTLLDDLWQGFKEAIRIRRYDGSAPMILPPEHQFFLYENIRQHLEVARLAVVRVDNGLYGESLDNVRRWLNHYFDADHTVTQQVGETLDELRKINIRPNLPDISASLSVLQTRRQLIHDPALPWPDGDEGR